MPGSQAVSVAGLGPYRNIDTMHGAQMSVVTPYVTSDRESKVGAIFQGIQGTIDQIGTWYERLGYRPRPIDANQPYYDSVNRYVIDTSRPAGGFSVGGGGTGTAMLLLLGVGAFLLLRK